MTFLADPPTNDHSVALADWVELKAIAEQTSRLSRSVLRHQLREAFGVVGEDLDAIVDLTFSEMQRRSDLAGETYPFSESRSGFELRGDGRVTYGFLLVVAASPQFRALREQNKVAVSFEELLTHSVRRYLGNRANAVRFGTPPSGDRPSTWRDAVKWLASLLGVGLGPGRPSPRKQDGGVDAVGWIPFSDSRGGQLVVLAQATIEIDWWASKKHNEIQPQVWTGWIDFGRIPATAFGVPFIIPSNFSHWDELRRSTDVIFDRLRMCDVLGVDNVVDEEGLQWMDQEIERLTAA